MSLTQNKEQTKTEKRLKTIQERYGKLESWNKGKTGLFRHTEETKKQMSLSHIKTTTIIKDLENEETIIGIMLSDGHISKPRTEYANCNFSISIGQKYEGLKENLITYFTILGLKTYANLQTRKTGIIHYNVG